MTDLTPSSTPTPSPQTGDPGVPPQDAAPVAPASPFVVRRRAAGAFVPRPLEGTEGGGAVIDRHVLGARRSDDRRVTTRERKIAGDLPDWEPLPPGELIVMRPRS